VNNLRKFLKILLIALLYLSGYIAQVVCSIFWGLTRSIMWSVLGITSCLLIFAANFIIIHSIRNPKLKIVQISLWIVTVCGLVCLPIILILILLGYS
jgi:hypothetical protein